MRKSTSSLSNVHLSGDLLVGDFLAALTNRMTAETAKIVAEQTEADTLRTVQQATLNPGAAYLNPNEILSTSQDMLVRSSLDAHVKKVQAEQVSAMAADQLSQMQSENQIAYVGKKVQINVLDHSSNPVESYWVNSKTGQETTGIVKKSSINGVIDTVALDKNLLLIKPTLGSRLINPARKYFLVYVINPQTLTPAVKISLL
ncbi:MAG: hypothetical protein V4702_05645 [Patescibacteria group bacterium]